MKFTAIIVAAAALVPFTLAADNGLGGDSENNLANTQDPETAFSSVQANCPDLQLPGYECVQCAKAIGVVAFYCFAADLEDGINPWADTKCGISIYKMPLFCVRCFEHLGPRVEEDVPVLIPSAASAADVAAQPTGPADVQ